PRSDETSPPLCLIRWLRASGVSAALRTKAAIPLLVDDLGTPCPAHLGLPRRGGRKTRSRPGFLVKEASPATERDECGAAGHRSRVRHSVRRRFRRQAHSARATVTGAARAVP